MDIFVPGRLCLFGEHSDWAAQYRRINPNIKLGRAIVVGTNQGIYAKVSSQNHLWFKTINNSRILQLPMDEAVLLDVAKTNSFYSYAAGVAYEALNRYEVGGLAIDNYKMDLPLKKGVSSSAAICVLVARAFNLVYQLGLTVEAEMDLAYQGERNTPSQCGRLDQACAYGSQPILMTFDGDRSNTTPLKVGQEMYLIVVDLAGKKNTQKILADLNQCYPAADNQIQKRVQKYLGEINLSLIQQAITAIEEGDNNKLGSLMNHAQSEFDRCLIPACSSELTAPILHQLLRHPPLQAYILGGKGVGSQGDGTAQLVCRDRHERLKAISLIQRDFPQME
ncbi:MAG: GHMP kinase, partial [Cyanobacteria bacterium P01_G01_bin.19]